MKIPPATNLWPNLDIFTLLSWLAARAVGRNSKGTGTTAESNRMSGGCFHTLSLVQFLKLVDDLHGKVAKGHGRIEITVDGCDDVCILISKAELEALERALEILSETGDFRTMCDSLSQVASLTCEMAASQSA